MKLKIKLILEKTIVVPKGTKRVDNGTGYITLVRPSVKEQTVKLLTFHEDNIDDFFFMDEENWHEYTLPELERIICLL